MYFRFKSLSEYFRAFPDIRIQSQTRRLALERLKEFTTMIQDLEGNDHSRKSTLLIASGIAD
jgi:hypothetical protein